jgi:hypothetical protein
LSSASGHVRYMNARDGFPIQFKRVSRLVVAEGERWREGVYVYAGRRAPILARRPPLVYARCSTQQRRGPSVSSSQRPCPLALAALSFVPGTGTCAGRECTTAAPPVVPRSPPPGLFPFVSPARCLSCPRVRMRCRRRRRVAMDAKCSAISISARGFPEPHAAAHRCEERARLQSRAPSPHPLRNSWSKHTGGGEVGKWNAPALPRVALSSVCRLFFFQVLWTDDPSILDSNAGFLPVRLMVGDAYRTVTKGERAERFGASYPFLDYGCRY